MLCVHSQVKESSCSVGAGLSCLLQLPHNPEKGRGANQEDYVLFTSSTLAPVQGRNNKRHCGQTINVILMCFGNLI